MFDKLLKKFKDKKQALEYIMPDECLEITPKHIRLRKVQLNAHSRNKQRTLQKTK